MLVLIAFMIIAYMVTVVFSVDVAYMQLVRAQLRSAADAAAKASTDTLSQNQSVSDARIAARRLATINEVAGTPLQLATSDIEFGGSRVLASGRVEFLDGATPVGATRILARRTADSPSGSVSLFFGGVLGVAAFEPVVSSTASRRDRDICLVVDRSGSMFGQKIADLKSAVTVFLNTLDETPQDELVGLASYSTNATLENNLVTDLSLIEQSMARMSAQGRTNIGGGIDVGRQILAGGRQSGFVDKTMVVMTDGIHNIGTDPIPAAQRAAAAGIVIHAITFGDGADIARMQRVASITGGTFNHAPDGDALIEIYREIAFTLVTQLTD
ncbi:MAG: VWA domain-containing protein [Planctomycetales bacterium]|nr:VWA domain-containing protein [Planctomycetales bacterium]